MNLHLIKSGKFKTSVFVLLLRRPLRRETATVTAVIPNILTRGCAKYPTLSAINRELEDMYGAVFEAQVVKKAEEQIIQLYMEIVAGDESLKLRALSFLNEILRPEGACFKEEYVVGEKNNLKLAIAGRINNKSEYARLRTLEEMCRDEAFGVYGDGYMEDVDALTPEGIYKEYQTILSGRAELAVMGDEDESRLAGRMRDIFRLESTPGELARPLTAYNPRETQYITEPCEITQGKICMGYRTGADNTGADVYRLMLMNEVLGGSAGSKLFVNVRERENLCYYVNSFVYRAKAIVFVQSGVAFENFDRVAELVNRQIAEIAAGNVSENELSNAKKSLKKKLLDIRDSQAASLDFYMSQRMLNDDADLETITERLGALTRDEVCEMAKKMRLDTVFRLTGEGADNEQR